MASWLVLDWDQDQFHILAAHSTRGGVKTSRAVTWAHPEPLTAASADRVGAALRAFLKAEGVGAAPVIFGIGRDRIFLKELRIPPIAAHEEASLVRFQTGKEMAESVDNYVVDYAYLKNDGDGERHILTVAVRKEVVALATALCAGAGLRLSVITPKLFGVGHALERAIAPEASPLAPSRLSAVLTIGQRWAELCFFRGQRLVQAQALANGPHLTAEVRRNLAVFGAQHAVDVDLQGPETLYVFGAEGPALEALRAGAPLPLSLLDPLRAEGIASGAAFAGAVGLAELWCSATPVPVNLSSPKRERAPSAISERSTVMAAALAAGVVIAVVGWMFYSLHSVRAEVAKLSAEQEERKKYLADNAQERADLESYKQWDQANIPWLDELHDLSARFPFEVGFRVNQFTATTPGIKKGSKDAFAGNLLLTGLIPEGKGDSKASLVNDLRLSMVRDPHLRIEPGREKTNDFTLKIDIAKQESAKYTTKLKVQARPKGEAPPPVVVDLKLTSEELKMAELIAAPEERVVSPPDDGSEKGDDR